MEMDELEGLSADALTSPIKSVRDAAEARLRFLSSYENWNTVKGLLPDCRTNYSRFIVSKAMRFIVTNELGPNERREVQIKVFEYLRDMRSCDVTLALYVRNELYSICASVIYIDWKISEMSMEQKAEGCMGDRIVEELSKYLQVSEVLECLLELLTCFMHEDAKAPLVHMRNSFVKDALPSFFRLATSEMARCSQQALEVSCAVLEAVPRLIVRAHNTTDATVFFTSGDGWFPYLTVAVSNCSEALLRDPQMELAGNCARFLRVASAIVCTDIMWFAALNAATELFLDVSEKLLQQYRQTGISTTLQLACALLVNVFERDEGCVTTYLYNRPELIESWAVVVRYALNQWFDGEEDIRQELMHLFFLFADRVIPSSRGNHVRCAMGRGIGMATDLASATGEKSCHVRTEELAHEVLQVFQTYFDSVVSKSHLTEDAQELRTDEGVILHNEKTLIPLAEMLFCSKVDFHATMVQKLMTTIEHYELAVRARKSGSSEALGELMLFLAVDTESLCSVLRVENVPLVLMHVCLSRLSVVISIVAISILNDTSRRGSEMMHIIARFARELLSVDDAITTALLECLSLFDDTSISNNESANKEGDGSVRTENIGGISNYNSNTNTSANAGPSSNGEAPHMHVGIIRALFFFCGCVCDSGAEWYDDFYDIMLRLLRFVYLHSDNTILTLDANYVLSKVLVHGVRGAFLSSDWMLEVLTAVRDDRIALLRVGSAALTPELTRARAGFLTSLTFYAETRHYGGYGAADALPCLIARSLARERLFADPIPLLRDMCAVADGAHQPATLFWLLEGLAASRPALLELVAALTACAPLVLQLCARVCVLAAQLMPGDCMCELRWEIASLSLHVAHNLMQSLSSPRACDTAAEEALFSFSPGVADETVLYNIADVVCALFEGNWCSPGVLFYYEKELVTRVLCGSVGLFVGTPVNLLMSSESHREQIFHAFHHSFSASGPLGDSLFAAFTAQQLWQPVLQQLVKCLRYVFLSEVLVTIEAMMSNLHRFDDVFVFVNTDAIGDIFYELIVLIATSPSMEKKSIERLFHILTLCFDITEDVCNERLDQLLQSCSAYHRVRLRVIGGMLRSGRGDMSAYFVSVFGTGSKVQTLSAW